MTEEIKDYELRLGAIEKKLKDLEDSYKAEVESELKSATKGSSLCDHKGSVGLTLFEISGLPYSCTPYRYQCLRCMLVLIHSDFKNLVEGDVVNRRFVKIQR